MQPFCQITLTTGYIWYNREGLRGRVPCPVPSSLYLMQQPTNQGQCTNHSLANRHRCLTSGEWQDQC